MQKHSLQCKNILCNANTFFATQTHSLQFKHFLCNIKHSLQCTHIIISIANTFFAMQKHSLQFKHFLCNAKIYSKRPISLLVFGIGCKNFHILSECHLGDCLYRRIVVAPSWSQFGYLDNEGRKLPDYFLRYRYSVSDRIEKRYPKIEYISSVPKFVIKNHH